MEHKDFYLLLSNNRLITPVWEYVLNLVEEELKDNSSKELFLKISTIYFSLIDDGNITISLDKDILTEKWNKKLDGIYQLLSSLDESDEAIEQINNDFKTIRDESKIIIDQINVVNETNFPEIIGNNRKIFEIEDGYLYVQKYNHARKSIKNSIKELFSKSTSDDVDLGFLSHIKPKDGKPYILSDGQKEIIKKGINKNLIVTGGPGTGKTSSVLFTLVALLEKNPNAYKDIYMTAPSGKASSRIKESVQENMELFDDDYKSSHPGVFERIKKVHESTIHKLLGTNRDGSFKYNKDKKLPDGSIFVIDEASMIDICLFAALLEAIPNTAKIFILGDKNQLPSVESGAVFAELLKMDMLKDNKVELDESIRFKKETDIYHLADEINDDTKEITYKNEWEIADKLVIRPTDSEHCPVYFYEYDKNKKDRLIIDSFIKTWAEEFYVKLQKASCDLDPDDIDALDNLFNMSKEAKILCAENEGFRGVKYINTAIKKRYIIDEFKGIYLKEYPGLLMMVNTNNDFLHLYNGDSGILVTFKGDETIYFMVDSIHPRIQNVGKNDGTMFRLGNYTFYPITSIKTDEIDLAFAITIHKSQGSDYNNILVILPNRIGHPLLSKQIIYTAITRTKGNTYILSSKDRLKEAKNNFISRDTNIA